MRPVGSAVHTGRTAPYGHIGCAGRVPGTGDCDDLAVGLSNRERRAAKQRRREQRRGGSPAGPHLAAPPEPVGRGLPPETLRLLLRRTGADLAAGHEDAVGELRRLLTEHLARRRGEVLAACDEVVADLSARSSSGGDGGVPAGLLAALPADDAVSRWAQAEGATAEQAVVVTVRLLAVASPAS